MAAILQIVYTITRFVSIDSWKKLLNFVKANLQAEDHLSKKYIGAQ